MAEAIEPNESIVNQLYQHIMNEEVNNVHTQLHDDKYMARVLEKHCKKAAKFDLDHNH